MAVEMVSCAVAQEAVNEVLSRIKEGYAEKSDAKGHRERMEMAHIKLEATLETSNKWNITTCHCCVGRASSSAGSDCKKRKK